VAGYCERDNEVLISENSRNSMTGYATIIFFKKTPALWS